MSSSSPAFCAFVLVLGPMVGMLLAAGAKAGIARYAAHLHELPAAERRRRALMCAAVFVGPTLAACFALEFFDVAAHSDIESSTLIVVAAWTLLSVFVLAAVGELLLPRRGIVMTSAVAMLAAVLRVLVATPKVVLFASRRAMRRLIAVLPPPRRRLVDVNLANRLLPVPRPARG